jgi:O-antigen/teichoic acid export membrane protein
MAFAPDFAQASGIILILALARMIEALTGPASALVEMIGHRLLPLLNGIAGVTVLIVLQFVLTPEYGALGAATAVAVGVNVTSTLSLIEAYFLYDLQPYSRALVRPFAIAIVSTLLMAWLGSLIGLGALAGPAGLAELTGADRGVAVVAVYSLGILVTLALIVRYGLRAEDAHALGSIGRWLRGST